MHLRSAPGGPRSGPRGPKTVPRGARSAPRAPQEPPKSLKKGSKKVFVLGWALGAAPGGLREPFWSVFGASGGAFWSHFGAMFGPISAAFSWLCSSCFRLLLAPFAAVLGPERPERNRRTARETLPAPSPRRGRAAAEQGPQAIVEDRCLDAFAALALLAWLLLVLALSLSRCACSSCCSCPSCRAGSSRCSRASRSTIARFWDKKF